MVDDIDIWRTASLLLRHHAKDATVIAAQRRDAPLAAGDTNGTIIWTCVMTEIDELTLVRRDGERVN